MEVDLMLLKVEDFEDVNISPEVFARILMIVED